VRFFPKSPVPFEGCGGNFLSFSGTFFSSEKICDSAISLFSNSLVAGRNCVVFPTFPSRPLFLPFLALPQLSKSQPPPHGFVSPARKTFSPTQLRKFSRRVPPFHSPSGTLGRAFQALPLENPPSNVGRILSFL